MAGLLPQLWRDYPYLWGVLGGCLLSGLLLLAWRAQRRLLLAAGLLHLPFAFGAILHVPAYWDPQVIARWLIAPEDLLFTFEVSVTCCFLAYWPMRRRLAWQFNSKAALQRLLLPGLAGGGTFAVLHLAGGGQAIMSITLWAYLATACAVLARRPGLWPCALYGLAGYPALYVLQSRAALYFWPEFARQWTLAAQLPWSIHGIPGYEVLWAAGFGLAWPLFAAYVLGVGPAPAHSPAVALKHAPPPPPAGV